MAAKKAEEKTEKKPKSKTSKYAKQIADLQKQISDFGEYKKSTEEFIKGASVVVNTLASSPELTKSFREQLGRQYPDLAGQESGQQPKSETETKPSTSGQSPTSPQPDKRVDELVQSQREEIVADFESKYGISGLKDEEKTEARRKVEGYLNEFGWSVKTMPLPQLRASLEKAYVGTHAEKLREEGKLEGIAQVQANKMGAMGSMPSSSPRTDHDEGLSDKQQEWVEKLGVDADKAKKTYLTRADEETRVPKSEKPE